MVKANLSVRNNMKKRCEEYSEKYSHPEILSDAKGKHCSDVYV